LFLPPFKSKECRTATFLRTDFATYTNSFLKPQDPGTETYTYNTCYLEAGFRRIMVQG
jgi:hypothetical protein